mgnify:CR=1 FL=1
MAEAWSSEIFYQEIRHLLKRYFPPRKIVCLPMMSKYELPGKRPSTHIAYFQLNPRKDLRMLVWNLH